MTDPVVFRGLRGRTLDDQMTAASKGYGSVAEMALDELGELVLNLLARIDRLEAFYATDADVQLPEGEQ